MQVPNLVGTAVGWNAAAAKTGVAQRGQWRTETDASGWTGSGAMQDEWEKRQAVAEQTGAVMEVTAAGAMRGVEARATDWEGAQRA